MTVTFLLFPFSISEILKDLFATAMTKPYAEQLAMISAGVFHHP